MQKWYLILAFGMVALMSEVLAVNYNVTLSNFGYFNMSDGCAGEVSLLPNASYPLDMGITDCVTPYCTSDWTLLPFGQITSGTYNNDSNLPVNDSASLSLNINYAAYIRWRRILDNESRADVGETAVCPTNDRCLPISESGVRVRDDGSDFMGTDSIYMCQICGATSSTCQSVESALSMFDSTNCGGTEYFFSGKVNSTSRIFEGYNPDPSTANLSGDDPNNGLCKLGYSYNRTYDGACTNFGSTAWIYLGYNHTGDPQGNNLVYLFTGCSNGTCFDSNLSNLCTYAGDTDIKTSAFILNNQSGVQTINTSEKLFFSADLIWNDYPTIGSYGTNPTIPALNDEVYLWINISDADGVSSCVFDARDPNGLSVLNWENASNNADGIWNSSSFEANVSGLYWYNLTCYELRENLSSKVESGFDDSDVTPPNIILDAPTGTYVLKSNIPLKWSSEPLRTCWYTLDGGVSNTTISCSSNTTFSVGSNGDYILTFTGEDYGSNQNSSLTSFTVNEPSGEPPGGGGGVVILPQLLKNLGELCIEDNECASGICYAAINETESSCKASLCGNGICDFSVGESINDCFIDCGAKTPAYKMALTVAIPFLIFAAVMFYWDKKKKNKGRKKI